MFGLAGELSFGFTVVTVTELNPSSRTKIR
jgi:hypothetical protein